jgi:hypothetical protein
VEGQAGRSADQACSHDGDSLDRHWSRTGQAVGATLNLNMSRKLVNPHSTPL